MERMLMLAHQYFNIDATSMLTWDLTDSAAAQLVVHLGDCLPSARITPCSKREHTVWWQFLSPCQKSLGGAACASPKLP